MKRLCKRTFLLPDYLELVHQAFLVFRLELKYRLFLGLEPVGLQTRSYIISSPGSQALDSDWQSWVFIDVHEEISYI